LLNLQVRDANRKVRGGQRTVVAVVQFFIARRANAGYDPALARPLAAFTVPLRGVSRGDVVN